MCDKKNQEQPDEELYGSLLPAFVFLQSQVSFHQDSNDQKTATGNDDDVGIIFLVLFLLFRAKLTIYPVVTEHPRMKLIFQH